MESAYIIANYSFGRAYNISIKISVFETIFTLTLPFYYDDYN